MVENRPWLTALSHIVLILGVLITALPIWITFVASTHPVEVLMAGRTPLWPGTASSRTTRPCSAAAWRPPAACRSA